MKVSVIVPVYNVENYLEKCLNSLINQTLKEIEIIVVNDGTLDNSQTIIDEYKCKYSDKITSLKKENGGLSSARNFGLKYATGEFVAFVDSDDYVEPNMFELMYKKAKDYNYDIVCCSHYEVRDDNIEIKKISNIEGVEEKNRYLFQSICAWDKLIKRKLIIDNNWSFPEGIWYEDFASTPALALFTDKIGYVDEPLYYYLIRNGSIMNQVTYNKKMEDIFKSYSCIRKKIQEHPNYEKINYEFEFMCIKHLLHDASLRFLQYDNKEAKDNVNKIVEIIHKDFPNWKKNKYLFLMSKKELLLTKIIFNKLFWLYKIYRKI